MLFVGSGRSQALTVGLLVTSHWPGWRRHWVTACPGLRLTASSFLPSLLLYFSTYWTNEPGFLYIFTSIETSGKQSLFFVSVIFIKQMLSDSLVSSFSFFPFQVWSPLKAPMNYGNKISKCIEKPRFLLSSDVHLIGSLLFDKWGSEGN